MSRQRALIPTVMARFVAIDPGCSIVLVGSVQRGYERPESDIDLLVIVHDGVQFDPVKWEVRWENRGAKSLDGVVEGIHACVFFASVSGLERWITETPHHMYPFSQGEVLRDPEGLVARLQPIAREYFRLHPAIAEEWEAQLQAHKLVKLNGRDENGFYRASDGQRRRYKTLDEFAGHISNLSKQQGS